MDTYYFNLQADSVMLLPGERYDFVLSANFDNVTNHWIRMVGLARCIPSQTQQNSILRYKGAPEVDPQAPDSYWIGFNRGGMVGFIFVHHV